ncbi:Hsp33 family molecular chaperone HslO [Parashewanella spongiae]|uniref:33 kDa chaperonin n=1 Tax=Parashewanella spongiae TaxID=342950 RepID=A0A3A6UMA2_9GAMM|nr:Hsp33 family molecular chaperone HslO [Parashewanella spongiae]MCL1077143.1 Hsp33 family molecular chaperone HslO [Parashewanella spongiae]RJY18834.1 Hsp33 family molecular chaperone HslO [Parashewanella spongiae]
MSIDTLHRYLFDNADVRGEIVQLEQSYQQIITSHNYPKVLRNLLGELMVASSLLTATLKFKGDIAVQIQGDGPVSLAVINGNDQQQLRGVARWQGELKDNATLAELFGKGHLVITLTPEEGERYQGVVALDKPNLAGCIEAYFMQSEQLPTRLWLFTNDEKAAGIFLQVLPSDKDHLDDFDHLTQLTATTKPDEIFTLPAEELLHRLYHEEQVRLFEPVDVSFKCRCSRERTSAAILSLPKEEVASILEEQNAVELDCEYCNTRYRFDSIDVAAIYAHST